MNKNTFPIENEMSPFLQHVLHETIALHSFVFEQPSMCPECQVLNDEYAHSLILHDEYQTLPIHHLTMISKRNGMEQSETTHACLECFHSFDIIYDYHNEDYTLQHHEYNPNEITDFHVIAAINRYSMRQLLKENFNKMKQDLDEIITCYGVYQPNVNTLHVAADIKSFLAKGHIGKAFPMRLTIRANDLQYQSVDELYGTSKESLHNGLMNFICDPNDVLTMEIFDVFKDEFIPKEEFDFSISKGSEKTRQNLSRKLIKKYRKQFGYGTQDALDDRLGESIRSIMETRFPEQTENQKKFNLQTKDGVEKYHKHLKKQINVTNRKVYILAGYRKLESCKTPEEVKNHSSYPSYVAVYDLRYNSGFTMQSGLADSIKFLERTDAEKFLQKAISTFPMYEFSIAEVDSVIFGKPEVVRFVYVEG